MIAPHTGNVLDRSKKKMKNIKLLTYQFKKELSHINSNLFYYFCSIFKIFKFLLYNIKSAVTITKLSAYKYITKSKL